MHNGVSQRHMKFRHESKLSYGGSCPHWVSTRDRLRRNFFFEYLPRASAVSSYMQPSVGTSAVRKQEILVGWPIKSPIGFHASAGQLISARDHHSHKVASCTRKSTFQLIQHIIWKSLTRASADPCTPFKKNHEITSIARPSKRTIKSQVLHVLQKKPWNHKYCCVDTQRQCRELYGTRYVHFSKELAYLRLCSSMFTGFGANIDGPYHQIARGTPTIAAFLSSVLSGPDWACCSALVNGKKSAA